MKLISFGCSHTYGSELPDSLKLYPGNSNLTWPALVAQKLNLPYSSVAYPGRGNLFIAEQVLNEISQSAVFVINWTYIDRFDFKDINNKTVQHYAGSNWTTCRPGESSDHDTMYYKYFHSEYADKLTSLIQIKACIDVLIQNKKSFIMTCLDDLIFDCNFNTSSAIEYLQDQIRPYITMFDNENFLHYAKTHGFPVTASDHLTAEGHRFCADHVISLLDAGKISTVNLKEF